MPLFVVVNDDKVRATCNFRTVEEREEKLRWKELEGL